MICHAGTAGVGSVVLPGAVIPEGATLSPLACASASSKMRPGFIHIGASASPSSKLPQDQPQGKHQQAAPSDCCLPSCHSAKS